MELYFSDYFGVDPQDLERYGALNISLVTDLPLFIDPFLLFHSTEERYIELHDGIIRYLRFLKDKSEASADIGKLKSWYTFGEVKQNWLGFSVIGNKGSALGLNFAKTLHSHLHNIFHDFGKEKITQGSHLEKLCLISKGVGKDKISDFTTNLIKNFLLEYTQIFALRYIDAGKLDNFTVPRSSFNYQTEAWMNQTFRLPKFQNDFAVLTPKNILTRDETWINKNDIVTNFENIIFTIDNDSLRFKLDNYLKKVLAGEGEHKQPSRKKQREAYRAAIAEYPELIDYYIRYKEEHGDQAGVISEEKVRASESIFIEGAKSFIAGLEIAGFYKLTMSSSREEAAQKIRILKKFIEDQDGYRVFYYKNQCQATEEKVQLLFKLVCCVESGFDINREVNNGRGSVDFKISKGSNDMTLVEFKLAKNTRLRNNLQKQVEIYERANDTTSSFRVIIYFTESEYKRVIRILEDNSAVSVKNIILIDARNDNKVSASNA